MEQISRRDHQKKQQERTLIRWLYQIEKWVFQIYSVYAVLLLATILIALVGINTAWGTFILNNTIHWEFVLPLSLVMIIIFPITDTFIQSKEENWFARYGSSVQARVVDYVPTQKNPPVWLRWISFWIFEQRVKLEWQDPEDQQIYTYTQRVRNQHLPPKGLNMPVLIDRSNPSYYLKSDINYDAFTFRG